MVRCAGGIREDRVGSISIAYLQLLSRCARAAEFDEVIDLVLIVIVTLLFSFLSEIYYFLCFRVFFSEFLLLLSCLPSPSLLLLGPLFSFDPSLFILFSLFL